ncbi:hypothetical protein ACJX0J_031945 [Zea mays]
MHLQHVSHVFQLEIRGMEHDKYLALKYTKNIREIPNDNAKVGAMGASYHLCGEHLCMHLHPAIFCFIFFGTPDPTLHPRQIYLLKVRIRTLVELRIENVALKVTAISLFTCS